MRYTRIDDEIKAQVVDLEDAASLAFRARKGRRDALTRQIVRQELQGRFASIPEEVIRRAVSRVALREEL
jgi:hypothetical protein